MVRQEEIQRKIAQLVDGVMLGVVFWLAHGFREQLGVEFGNLNVIPPFERFFWLLAVIVPVSPIVLDFQGFYNHPLRKKPGDSLRSVCRAGVVLALIFGMCVIFLKWSAESRSVLLMFLAMGSVALLGRAWLWRQHFIRRSLQQENRERVVLAGTSEDIDLILAKMPREQRLQIQIVGRVDLDFETEASLTRLFREKAVERVLFVADHMHFGKVEKAIFVCENEGVEAWLAADFIHPTISRLSIEHFGQSPMLVFRATPENGWALLFKEVFDRVGAAILLLLTSPLWLFAVIGIRIASPAGPLIFRQERSGRYGKKFTMFKFRTMHPGAERDRAAMKTANELRGPAFKISDDPRVFKFGAILRKLSIDELPQLVNVLRGEMSLVGPRPLPVYEIEQIENAAQRRRLSVKPGLTCLWQVSGRSSITNFDEWVRLDLEYIDNWSLWLDWKILAKTVPAVLSGTGAK